jgi:FG-GAP repeat protein
MLSSAKFLAALGANLTCVLASLTAQAVGGGHQTLYQFDGPGTSTSYGQAMADAGDVNGDGIEDLIVGAFQAQPGGRVRAGSAYVYSGANGSLLYQWDGAFTFNELGKAVAGIGDINHDGYDDLLVGAPGVEKSGMSSVGAADLYSGIDGSLIVRLRGVAEFDFFGGHLAPAGDMDGDGTPDFLVSSSGADPFGSVFAYSGQTGAVLRQWDGFAAFDGFGRAIASAGDINADGTPDVILSASGLQVNGNASAGAAFVYSGSDGTLLHQWQGQAYQDFFGSAVAGPGDVSGDGVPDVLIGSSFASRSGLSHNGTVSLFSGSDGSLIYQLDGQSSDMGFGNQVAGAGDLNGDGYVDFLVGAAQADYSGLTDSGAVFLYSGIDGAMLYRWTGVAAGDRLGDAVVGAFDMNADGKPDQAMSAPRGFLNSGSTFVYSFQPFLQADLGLVSAATGGVINLQLDFPDLAGLYEYKILISASGIGPTQYGIEIPLTRDSLVVDTYFARYPVSVYTDLQGSLDLNGQASASLTVPAGLNAALIGNTYHLAAIANQLGLLPEYSSVAVPITITL